MIPRIKKTQKVAVVRPGDRVSPFVQFEVGGTASPAEAVEFVLRHEPPIRRRAFPFCLLRPARSARSRN